MVGMIVARVFLAPVAMAGSCCPKGCCKGYPSSCFVRNNKNREPTKVKTGHRSNRLFTQDRCWTSTISTSRRNSYAIRSPRGGAALQRFLCEQNIERFRRQLSVAADDRQREVLEKLLAEEEAKARIDAWKAEGARRRPAAG